MTRNCPADLELPRALSSRVRELTLYGLPAKAAPEAIGELEALEKLVIRG